MSTAIYFLLASLVVILTGSCLFLVLLGLPGTWLMILFAALAEWWTPERHYFDVWTLVIAALLALLAEGVEFLAAATGARRAGASRSGTLGAMIGGIGGAIAGTFVIPIPVMGSIIGACAGAFTLAALMERSSGSGTEGAIKVGRGAALGHLFGMSVKLAVGVAVWLLLAVAAFWP